jgi:hypothetical protein
MITLAVGIFLLYCLIIALVYGVQKSISDSFYTTGQRGYFTVTMLTVMFLLMGGVKPNVWFIMGAFFLGLVGVAANFKFKAWIAEGVHVAGVFLSIGCFIVGMAIINIWVGLSALSLIALSVYLLRNVKNSTWWREIAIILIIYVFLMIL